MSNGDTVKLLRECNAGTKWQFIPWMRSVIKFQMQISKMSSWHPKKHERLGNEIHAQLENAMIRQKNQMRLQKECPG